MKRRRFLYVTSLFLFLMASCNSGEEKTDEQSPNIAQKEVEPVFIQWNCEQEEVQIGEEIALYYEWITKTSEQSDEYFDVTKHMVSINGVPTSIKNEGLSEISEESDGNLKRRYWMNIGELDPGTYEVVSVAEITERVYDGWDWYGPESDYESFQASCTITIGELDQEQESAPENDVPELPTPTTEVCSISSPFNEDWNTFICETFDSSTNLWTGQDQGTTAKIEGGRYILDNSTKVEFGYKTGFIYPIDVGTAQDYMVSVDGFMDSKFRQCTWGVFVRSTSSEVVYFFMINNEGVYTLTGSSDNEANRYLGNIKDGRHNSIIWDDWNNISAVVDGTTMEFYINGEFIVAHEAINATNPAFGLIVWGGEGVSAITYFDNLIARSKY